MWAWTWLSTSPSESNNTDPNPNETLEEKYKNYTEAQFGIKFEDIIERSFDKPINREKFQFFVSKISEEKAIDWFLLANSDSFIRNTLLRKITTPDLAKDLLDSFPNGWPLDSVAIRYLESVERVKYGNDAVLARLWERLWNMPDSVKGIGEKTVDKQIIYYEELAKTDLNMTPEEKKAEIKKLKSEWAINPNTK